MEAAADPSPHWRCRPDEDSKLPSSAPLPAGRPACWACQPQENNLIVLSAGDKPQICPDMMGPPLASRQPPGHIVGSHAPSQPRPCRLHAPSVRRRAGHASRSPVLSGQPACPAQPAPLRQPARRQVWCRAPAGSWVVCQSSQLLRRAARRGARAVQPRQRRPPPWDRSSHGRGHGLCAPPPPPPPAACLAKQTPTQASTPLCIQEPCTCMRHNQGRLCCTAPDHRLGALQRPLPAGPCSIC